MGPGRKEVGVHLGRHMEEIAFAVVTKPYDDWEFYSDSSHSVPLDIRDHDFKDPQRWSKTPTSISPSLSDNCGTDVCTSKYDEVDADQNKISKHQMEPYGTRQRHKILACDSCRLRKIKCDEGRPECQHCKDNNLKCFYRDMPLQKQSKQAQAMIEKLDTMNENINRMLQIQEEQARHLSMLQSLLPVDKSSYHAA
jgi:Fungal Zn(2)-Cys(6) binuclear cluster domain